MLVTTLASSSSPPAVAVASSISHRPRSSRDATATATATAGGADATAGDAKKRVLCLHGKGGNGASFARHLKPLLDATSETIEWYFADGHVREPNGGFGWWELAPGVRTFQASELPGLDESLRGVRETGPWDGLFGFSQGAMLAALAAAEKDDSVTEFCVIVGAAWPACAAAKLEEVSDAGVRTLHVVGARDGINPPEQARRVAAAFGAGARTFDHDGGHVVPMDDAALRAYVEFILDA